MFIMRLSASGRGYPRAYLNEAQEVFLDGHVRAFEHFGGVPSRIRYDNLKAAVERVLKGRDRIESDRFIALRSHYGFDSFFCQPGIKGSHEKGGVEGEVGRFRRRHLVPVPARRLDGRAQRAPRRRARPATTGGSSPTGASPSPSTSRSRPTRCGRCPANAFDVDRGVRPPGRPQEPGVGPRLPLLGPGPPRRPAARGPRRRRDHRGPRRRRGRRPPRPRPAKATRSWCWTTTSRCWPSRPARSPAPPRWPEPAPAACSAQRMNSSGPRPADVSATATAPAP